MSRLVVGVGVQTLEDFSAFGQEAVEQVEAADGVVSLSPSGWASELKSGEEIPIYIYEDVESTLFECAQMIKDAWDERCDPAEAHLGHAAAGMWMFYWLAPDLSTMRQLVRAGRSADLCQAADDYIKADFGAKHGPLVQVP